MFEPLDQITLARAHRDEIDRDLAHRALLRSFPDHSIGRVIRAAAGQALIRAGETLAGLPHRSPSPAATPPAIATTR
ncbi:MAG: hypothetical protein AVDCRST_MAG70-515 [uncultured Thermomicrobiales bacterium]|uniref:Uncharacterized protein n=1 Tax=uncultured Thermomicrobiales bacterium TaxID=1645740 RepID=A0A6J4UB93_9BACT|nr:MAG: hypothetical protein AVDCRST_MAG70-515 [uncultured Thermomicrobiales bacterium]